MWLIELVFSSILQIWYVEVRISRSISKSPLEFEITRVDCISSVTSKMKHYRVLNSCMFRYRYIISNPMLSTTSAPQRQKTYLRRYVPSRDSGQPPHSHSLIRIFIGCILDSQECKLSLMRTTKILIGLHGCGGWFELSFVYISKGTFSHVGAQMVKTYRSGDKTYR